MRGRAVDLSARLRPVGRAKAFINAQRAASVFDSPAVAPLAEKLDRLTEKSVRENGVLDTQAVARDLFDMMYGALNLASVVAMVDRAVKIDALSRLLTEAIGRCSTTDGRIDFLDVSSFILEELARNSNDYQQARRSAHP